MTAINNQTIAVFDFDGTITTRDTFFDFLIFSQGILKTVFGLARCNRILFRAIIGLMPRGIAKESIFEFFFKGILVADFKAICTAYSTKRIHDITRHKAFKKLEWHRKQGHVTVIVSASLISWIEQWAHSVRISRVIATVPEVWNGVLTGKFKTKNCNREEKVRRFLEYYPNRAEYTLYVYGDSKGDKQLFDIADRYFYKNFD